MHRLNGTHLVSCCAKMLALFRAMGRHSNHCEVVLFVAFAVFNSTWVRSICNKLLRQSHNWHICWHVTRRLQVFFVRPKFHQRTPFIQRWKLLRWLSYSLFRGFLLFALLVLRCGCWLTKCTSLLLHHESIMIGNRGPSRRLVLFSSFLAARKFLVIHCRCFFSLLFLAALLYSNILVAVVVILRNGVI